VIKWGGQDSSGQESLPTNVDIVFTLANKFFLVGYVYRVSQSTKTKFMAEPINIYNIIYWFSPTTISYANENNMILFD